MPPGGGRTEAATKDPEASESVLEEVSNTVTSPADSTDGQGHQDGIHHQTAVFHDQEAQGVDLKAVQHTQVREVHL